MKNRIPLLPAAIRGKRKKKKKTGLKEYSRTRNKMFMKERVLDAEQWRVEAAAVIGDVRDHVRDLRVSECPALRSSNRAIFLNLTTLEGLEFCVRLSAQGFSVVGNRHDCADNADEERDEYYETIYSLLDRVSPQYRNSFGNSLLDRLLQLQERQEST